MIMRTLVFVSAALAVAACARDSSDVAGAAEAPLTLAPPSDSVTIALVSSNGRTDELLISGTGLPVTAYAYRHDLIAEGVIPAVVFPGDAESAKDIERIALSLVPIFRGERPTIVLSRPMSADTFFRRTDREADLYVRIIAALKKRYGFSRFVGVGHSGGAHIVIDRFTKDVDMVCAVSVAGLLDLDAMQRAHGRRGMDAEEWSPIDRIGRLPRDGRPLVHIQNPHDKIVPEWTSRNYARRVPPGATFRWVSANDRISRSPHSPFEAVPGAVRRHCSVGCGDRHWDVIPLKVPVP